jgi:antitoxin (DNA-binding transcriptional repressor) of toxin-antitoxin stability system
VTSGAVPLAPGPLNAVPEHLQSYAASPAARRSQLAAAASAIWMRKAYVMYTRNMTENALPLPYEVQEMTTTEARKRLPELVNMAAYGHVTTVLVRDGRRLARIVPEEDAWIYSPAWQDKLREAEADVAAERVRRFDTDDDFLTHLENLDDEAGG